ncbi:hypothetical protein F2Q69_00041509 [Brassica cretica]|uniref:Uncharacterized protein n=1 Tax=Brassica cretica TaxID=69181 RepID=A0A8S9NL69_BRACR|nr:hypothetical protein F2Q69_00041509 [Brassica cretica]
MTRKMKIQGTCGRAQGGDRLTVTGVNSLGHVRHISCPPDQLQPQGVPDPRQTQLHLASRTARVPDCKRPVRIRAARDPDCNSSRSTISCSRLQPQSVRVQASSCSARVPAQLEVHSLGGPVSAIY